MFNVKQGGGVRQLPFAMSACPPCGPGASGCSDHEPSPAGVYWKECSDTRVGLPQRGRPAVGSMLWAPVFQLRAFGA